jgi:hypothetical protein
VRRLLLSCLLLGMGLLWAAAETSANPVITSSDHPKTGANNPVTFTGPLGASGYAWDLNGDLVFGEEVGHATAIWTYDLPGPVNVGLRYTDLTGPHEVVESFDIDGPPVGFLFFPAAPVPGQEVTFAYSAGPAVSAPPEWDLNGDGVFPDATGPRAKTTFGEIGTHFVGLRITGGDDAQSTGYQAVRVVAASGPLTGQGKALRLMSPFPIVRITGKVLRKGARIKRLTVRAPYGATVKVRCRGRGCPFHRSSRTLARAGKTKAPSKTISIKRLERHTLRGGASIKVLVTRQGEIGKYTRFLIRRGKPPRRTDLCLAAGSTEPMECPSS